MALTDDTPVPDYSRMLDLSGRGVVVLGAGQGIGRQAVHAAVSCGARVACIDLEMDRAQSVADEVGGIAISGDVTVPENMRQILAEATDVLGRMDALIDIIGMPRYVPVIEMSDEDWQFQHDICLRQAFLAMREGGRLMKETGGGAMAFVSSISGGRSAPGHAAYGAAKAGLNSLIASAANEMARYGIRINGVAPGLTWTPRISSTMEPESRAIAEKSIPLRRPGQPSDIASVLLFLVSDLSSYITGQVLTADGGATTGYPIKFGAAPGHRR